MIPSTTSTESPSSDILNRCRVLLVEDNLIVQKVHRMMLQKFGCEVDIAEDGPKALELCENEYDVILMDIGLPGMDGLEVTSQIRQREAHKKARTPIITLTAYSNDDAKISSLAAGSDEVVTKPIAFNDLRQLLNRWISKAS